MSLTLDRTTHSSPETAYSLAGRTRWYAATLFVVGGLLQLAEFLLEPEHDSSRARVAWWLAHSTQLQLAQTAGLLAMAFMIGTFWFAYRLLRVQSPRLSAVAVSMLLCAKVSRPRHRDGGALGGRRRSPRCRRDDPGRQGPWNPRHRRLRDVPADVLPRQRARGRDHVAFPLCAQAHGRVR